MSSTTVSSTKLIVVIGATGKQGGSVARLFGSDPNWTVRGITRNPISPVSLALTSLGLTMVTADLSDTSTLTSALTGAHYIFCTTDFWGLFYNPSTKDLLKPGQTLGQYCYERELQQFKNVVDAAAKVESLEVIVVSSLCDATKASGEKYKGVYHWDSKARGVAYLREMYPELATKMSVVIMGNYMDNWKADLKLRKHDDGSYRLGLVGSGETPLPNIDIERDTGAIVRAALLSPPGKTILAAGSMISWSDQLKVWCKVNEVPFGGFDPISIDVFDHFFPIPGLGKELGEMMAFMDEFGYTGEEPNVVLPCELDVPCHLTSWEEYVKGQDWSRILDV